MKEDLLVSINKNTIDETKVNEIYSKLQPNHLLSFDRLFKEITGLTLTELVKNEK